MSQHSRSIRKVFFRSALVLGLLLSTRATVAQSESEPTELQAPCIVISEIEGSSVLTNTLVALKMRDGRQIHMHLENRCNQLKFHGRFAFRAEDGQLCVDRDMLISRSGEPCRILEFETNPEEG